MRPIGGRKSKKLFYILYNGKMVGQSWAVSPEKARVNFWWKFVKGEDERSAREYNPEDFDVVEGA